MLKDLAGMGSVAADLGGDSTTSWQVVDDGLIESLEGSQAEQERYVFLEPHPEFKTLWRVNSLNVSYFFEFREIIGPYRVLAPAQLEEFLNVAAENEYQVAFFEDPTTIMDAYEALNDPPPFELNSDFEGTIGGLLPFQLQGFNFLKDLDGGVAQWSTGTGKTVLASALIKYRLYRGDTDLTWFVAKAHNKTNVQRALKRLADIESIVVDGGKERREAIYTEIASGNCPPVVVVNYEKFRDDHDLMLPFFDATDAFVVWDEMPTKLGGKRKAGRYTSVCKTLYSSIQLASASIRPNTLRQTMLSATPIERDPSSWFNCVRILDPTIYGSVSQFEGEFVRTYSRFSTRDDIVPETWHAHKLPKMGMMAAHITHQVDKEDPDIAKYFPEAIPIPTYIDWHESHRQIYDMLAKEAAKYDLDHLNTVAAIFVLQMLCDAPSMLYNSAALYAAWEEQLEDWIGAGAIGKAPKKEGSVTAFELLDKIIQRRKKVSDQDHTKLEKLHEILTVEHPGEKTLIYAALKTGLIVPGKTSTAVLEDRLREWGISYVVYAGTPNQRQAAQDTFMEDPDAQVFLSSDMGSDSLDLYEGRVCIHYDLPANWSTWTQRQNRIHRATSQHESVYYYTLMMANSVEERKMEIIERKKAYHDGVFKGVIKGQSASGRMSRGDLAYILTGT